VIGFLVVVLWVGVIRHYVYALNGGFGRSYNRLVSRERERERERGSLLIYKRKGEGLCDDIF
jgi:hypothetical protein